jgi:hypothetical protein
VARQGAELTGGVSHYSLRPEHGLPCGRGGRRVPLHRGLAGRVARSNGLGDLLHREHGGVVACRLCGQAAGYGFSGAGCQRSSRAKLRASRLVLVYVARVPFGCSRGYEGMSKVFHFDVAEVDLDVACYKSRSRCCGCCFPTLRMLFSNVADVILDMLQSFVFRM